MNVLSLFNGMSVCAMALEDAGITVDKMYISEIDSYANQATKCLFPDSIQLGSVCDWQSWDIDWSSIDMVTGGFPCQAWSMAGKQLGDKDERGMLFWVMLDIMKMVRKHNPSADFLIENVKMKKEFEEYITYHTENALGEVHKVLINSASVSAQNRNRYYWSNFIGKPVVYASDCIECESCGEPVCPSCNQHYSDCPCIGPTEDNIEFNDDGTRGFRLPENNNIDFTKILDSIDIDKGFKPATVRKGDPRPVVLTGDKFTCLTATYFKGIRADGRPAVAISNGVFDEMRLNGTCRQLTPRECMRLQTIPEHYIDKLLTAGISNTQLYKMTGNAWTMKVISHILKQLPAEVSFF